MSIGAAILLLAAGFCVLYLLNDYASLKSWYAGLGSCLYKSGEWPQKFFTPAAKAQGNIFCAAALGLIALALAWQVHLIRKVKVTGVFRVTAPAKEVLWIIALSILLCFFWYLGHSLTKPAADEVFSAIYSAGAHPVQAMSYYMAPNNHLLFNLLNSLFFSGFDQVIAGRLISLFAYILTGICLFYFFRRLGLSTPLAWLAAAVCTLQFCVWGFGFQARGYALYTLSAWVAVASLLAYAADTRIRFLILHAAACFTGNAALPSFLYIHAAMVVFVLIRSLANARWQKEYWISQAYAGILVFLFHLPAIGFSGIGALIANEYVKPLDFSVWEFIPETGRVLGWYSDYCFSGLPFAAILFIVPLGLLFARRGSPAFRLGVFYILMVFVFLVIVCLQRRMPFHRNMAAHCSIALAMVIYTLHLGCRYAAARMHPLFAWVPFSLALAAPGIYFMKKDIEDVHGSLYFYDTRAAYAAHENMLKEVPREGGIGFSDESFMLYYLASEKGYDAVLCPTGDEAFFVSRKSEPGPGGPYVKIKAAGEYYIYEKSKSGP